MINVYDDPSIFRIVYKYVMGIFSVRKYFFAQ